MEEKTLNSATYCYVCQESTRKLEQEGIVSVRTVDSLSGKTISICNECLKSLNRKLYTEGKRLNFNKQVNSEQSSPNIITPKYLYNRFNDFIIGQDKAKKAIALAVATHLRRLEDSLIEKSNILLIGPTGSGKTELARTVSKILKLPLAICDATTLTAHGYVGEDVEQILVNLLNSANGDVELAEKGIVFIDEFDKLAITREDLVVNTSSVQQSLLKMIEGGKVKIPKPGSKRNSDFVYIDTSKILFICSGAFAGLESQVQQNKKTPMGLRNSYKEPNNFNYDEITTKDLIQYGIIPEILGRLPIITATEPLSEEALVSILTTPKNNLSSQYQRILSNYGVSLEFTPCFLNLVAQEAINLGIGARGLRTIMEKKLEQALFEGPDMGGDKKIIASEYGIIFNPQNDSLYLKPTIFLEEKVDNPSIIQPKKRSRKKSNKDTAVK